MADKDLLADARAAFQECEDAEHENRQQAADDLSFARMAEQWPEQVRKQREAEGRPVLTINRLPTFVRQVVNEARQNRPQLKIKPVGEGADQATAQVYDGLIRNIHSASVADVAYDTAADFAASMGFGYFRIDVDYAYDDAFDLDILYRRVANPFTVYGDPHSTEADSCDWNVAFVTERLTREDFAKKYKGADVIDWKGDGRDEQGWVSDEEVRVAEYWTRSEVMRDIVKLSDGRIIAADIYAKEREFLFDPAGLTVIADRQVKSWKVRQRIITAADVLEDNEWSGRYIPLVPVYGEELNIEGKRVFKSLIRDAKDAQRMLNYWRTAATELVALAPKVPFIGPKGAFKSDARKWQTANVKSHPYLEYDGEVSPSRQPLDSGIAAGALQEALNASDDLKSIIGIYDASLGARSNETSGRAIMARQREGDVSTFHFLDNLSRGIRHGGKILLDLIPSVYGSERVIRTMSEDGSVVPVPLMTPVVPQIPPGEIQPNAYEPVPRGAQPPEGARIFDLTAGKYDVVVSVGPSFTTRREEAATQMVELIRANPPIAPLVADIMARNMDWPEADKIAERLKAALPPHLRGQGPPPEVLQMQEQMNQMGAQMQQMAQENTTLKQQDANKQADVQVKGAELQIDAQRVELEREKLQLERDRMMREVSKADGEQQYAQAHQMILEQLQQQAQAIQQVAEMAQAAMEMAAKPRAKKGTAVKLGDGRWALEAVEEIQPTIQ